MALSIAIVFFLLCFATKSLQNEYIPLYVDGVNGKDTNNGNSTATAFKSIVRARDFIRQMKNTTGLPHGRIYVSILQTTPYFFLDEPFSLTEEDSGTETTDIYYAGRWSNGRKPSSDGDTSWYTRLTAGVHFNMDAVSPIASQTMRNLLPKSLQDKIVQVDLRKLGITDYGDLASGMLGDCANNKLELFAEDMDMVLARYPNINEAGTWQWISTGKVLNSTNSFTFDTNSTVQQRILSWKNTSTLWLHGYWTYDWADNYVKVDHIDKEKSAFVTNSTTPPLYGFKSNARFYALNLLEELDVENEYYVDRKSGLLYMFATTAAKLAKQEKSCLSVGNSVIAMDSVSYVYFYGILADCSRLTAVECNNCSHLVMTYFAAERTGASGISVTGQYNEISVSVNNTGCGGVHFSGGDVKSLTPGGNRLNGANVRNFAKWKRTYQPGFSWGGVENCYTEVDVKNGPHAGVLGDGVGCIFAGMNLENLCYETSDSGAFYTGRSWISRGNIIKYSSFKNIFNTEKPHLGAMSVQAIYLDDQMSGWLIQSNRFINCHVGVFIGGGRRNTVAYGNNFTNCSTSVHIDNRGMTWQAADCSPGGLFEQQLKSVNYQQPPWSTQYPELVNIFQDHPCVPVYNSIANNTYCRGGQFIDITPNQASEWLDTVKNNEQVCDQYFANQTYGRLGPINRNTIVC